jgi:hypothetical protein
MWEKQVETSYSRPSPSLEFASKKRSGALVIGSRELSRWMCPIFSAVRTKKQGSPIRIGPRRSHRYAETITIVMWAV